MPFVRFVKPQMKDFEVDLGANLMKSLLKQKIPVASSCLGDGVCAKCKIQILQGQQFLSQENSTEVFLKEKNSLPAHFRISCQTEVLGDITIDAGYW